MDGKQKEAKNETVINNPSLLFSTDSGIQKGVHGGGVFPGRDLDSGNIPVEGNVNDGAISPDGNVTEGAYSSGGNVSEGASSARCHVSEESYSAEGTFSEGAYSSVVQHASEKAISSGMGVSEEAASTGKNVNENVLSGEIVGDGRLSPGYDFDGQGYVSVDRGGTGFPPGLQFDRGLSHAIGSQPPPYGTHTTICPDYLSSDQVHFGYTNVGFDTGTNTGTVTIIKHPGLMISVGKKKQNHYRFVVVTVCTLIVLVSCLIVAVVITT